MIIPAGFLQANLVFSGVAAPHGAQVVFGCENVLDITNINTIGGAILDAYDAASFDDLMVNDISLQEIRIKLGPNSTGAFGSFPAVRPGTATAAGWTPNVAWLATKSTAFGGRSGRGRMYWPAAVETLADEAGNISGGSLTALNTALDNFLVELDTNSFPMVVLHGENSPAPAPYPVTSLLASTRVATQRRRLRR